MKRLLITSLLLIATGNCLVVNGQTITTVAGGGAGSFGGDGGPASTATLGYFAGMTIDKKGNLYISDGSNHRIRKIDATTNIISTIAGTGSAGYNGDGIPAISAQINNPVCITLDVEGNIYFYDSENHRIRRIDKSTGIISTYAGTGVLGSNGDGGPATNASIDGGDMAWDIHGNLYCTSNRKIRKIDPIGIISTFVGTGLPGITLDGVPATATNIAQVRGIAINQDGDVYIADSTASIRVIRANNGYIYRIAGTGDNVKTPYSGDGIAATTCHIGPFDLATDDTGNVYIPDFANSRIEVVDTFGVIRTIAGTGVNGFSGDDGPASLAKIAYPENVILDKCGNVYIADFMNRRVRKITYRECDFTSVINVHNNIQNVTLHPNPATETLTITAGVEIESVSVMNAVGQCVVRRAGSGEWQVLVDVGELPRGVYMVRVNEVYAGKMVKR